MSKGTVGRHLLLAFAVFVCLASGSAPWAQTWVPKGPAPADAGTEFGGDSLEVNTVAGAVEVVVAHPTNPDIVWIGTVNGGIFRTDNATAVQPTWTAQTDDLASLSIGALALDPTDPTHNTLVAGTGRTSAFALRGGTNIGLLRTVNGGASWTPVTAMAGRRIRGVAVRGSVIVVAAGGADSGFCDQTGIWRSTNFGASFTQISDNGVSGLPCGFAYDLAEDPVDDQQLFTAIIAGPSPGLYRSGDLGLNWVKVSDATMDGLFDGFPANVDVAVGTAGGVDANVFVAICDGGKELAGLFHSGDAGQGWASLPLPETNGIGIHNIPSCNVHLSLVADPNDHDVAYIGGDYTPPSAGVGSSSLSGRLFRVDAGPGGGSTPITHCATALPACGNSIRTRNNTAPHSDSRDMTFDANGDLLEVDDGGVYRHTDPGGTTGDWFSMAGNLAVIEQTYAAYDSVSKILISGNQDNGTTQQLTPASSTWAQVLGGDGGDVEVAENDPVVGQSTRYFSAQNFAFGQRAIYDVDNVRQSTEILPYPLVTLMGGPPPSPQRITPVRSNRVAPARVVFGAQNGVYESMDRLDTVTQISSAAINGLFAGGARIAYGVAGNPDVLYFVSGNSVYVRTAGTGAPTQTTPDSLSSDLVYGVVVDPDDFDTAFAIDPNRVFRTTSAGAAWSDITGNLIGLLPVLPDPYGSLRSIEYIASPSGDRLVVGARAGVYVAFETNGFTTWSQLGSDLPNAPIRDLEYDAEGDVLMAGTLGRGAWLLSPTTAPSVNQIGTAGAGSLPVVVAAAAPGSVVTFDSSVSGETITLASELVIDKDLTLDARSLPDGLAISGGNSTRVLQIAGGATVYLKGLTITEGRFSAGAGIYNIGTLTMTDCTVSDSAADQGQNIGGGILNAGVLTLERCTLSGNWASSVGGGLHNIPGGTATLINSTLSGNSAGFNGGGMINENGTANLVHVTVVGNTAGAFGGGIDNTAATLNIENSIVAGNTGPPPGNAPDFGNRDSGTVVPAGENFIGNHETVETEFPAGPLHGTPGAPLDPVLGPLTDNQGPTRTRAPAIGSPVINAALAGPTTVPIDQRGNPRPGTPRNELGAVELPECGNGILTASSEVCDDGNSAGGDCCSATCAYEPLTSSCDLDANACTRDVCDGAGTCLAGGVLNCDDLNACTDDGCDPVQGCVNAPNTNPCDDGNDCTTADACAGGTCLGGLPPPVPSGAQVPDLTMLRNKLLWTSIPDATGYDAVIGDLGLLHGADGDFSIATTDCLAEDLPALELDELTVPDPDSGVFYLVRGGNCSGSGSYSTTDLALAAQRDPGIDAAALTCSTGCERSKCVVGPLADPRCDACVDAICNADPFCCANQWDGLCVDQVQTVCLALVCEGSAGLCEHTVCTEGEALLPGCDSGGGGPGCVDAVCAADASCCNNTWGASCAALVESQCGYTCDDTLPPKTVFLSSSMHTGNLGGLAGADAICQALADAASLGGTYKAWLSDPSESPATRLSRWPGGYARPDGVTVADDWADLTDGTLDAPIFVTELGQVNPTQRTIQTSTDTLGSGVATSPGPYCLDWTSSAGSGVATRSIGRSDQVSGDWTNSGTFGCTNLLRLYCFEQ